MSSTRDRGSPTVEEAMRKEYLTIEDVAVLLSVTVDSVRTKIKMGSIPKPRRRGRRLYWKKSVFLDYMNGGDGDDSWTPPRPTPPHRPQPLAGRR